jgi:Ser/Thr protein kinase RdoA (MazF antagonist)
LKVLGDVLGSLEIAARNWKHVMINKMSWNFQYIYEL